MKLVLCSIFDSAVENFSPPFCVRATGLALRDFTREANNPSSRISQSPKDFTLFNLGVFDDEAGVVTMHTAPIRLVSGHEVLEASNG